MNERPRLPFDRWIEMDLQWFQPDRLDEQIVALLDRLGPLYQPAAGWRGLIFNVGWLIDLVTEWTGRVDQPLPLHSRRTAGWLGQTYDDLRAFVARLKQQAARSGLADLKVGVLFVNWGHVVWPPDIKIYDFDSDWYDRHPEVYGPAHSFIGMPELHPGRALRADSYPYAVHPNGVSEGTPFVDLFAAQWGSASRFLGLDALVLRDGFMGPMIYTRTGPFGQTAPPDPAEVRRWTDDVRRLFRSVKDANPDAIVMGYSSAVSAVADWRVGCVDFESIVADGAIDAWIDQTWGGAWQDWWHQEWKGWTFQLAYLLLHGAMVRAANRRRKTACRHYCLIETWDAWEPWDTLHQVPGKLRWAMWAFSHAAVVAGTGSPRIPDGSYISWANNRHGELLSEADVAFVGSNLDAAQASAARLERVYGPAAVYHRPAMEWLSAEHPDWNVSEWIDEHIGFLMKWGLPILSASRSEWIAAGDPRQVESLVLQTPGNLSGESRQALLDLMRDKPALIIGRADVIDPAVLRAAGARVEGDLQPKGYMRAAPAPAPLQRDLPAFNVLHLPIHQPIAAEGETLFRAETTPTLVRRGHASYWQPPDWSEPSNQFLPRYQVGSLASHALAARALGDACAQAGHSRAAGVPFAQPVAFHLWRSAGRAFVLLGNLETGLTGDARTERRVNLILDRRQLELATGEYVLREAGGALVRPHACSAREVCFNVRLEPEGSAVFTLEPAETTAGEVQEP
jgi:hypothetical protein